MKILRTLSTTFFLLCIALTVQGLTVKNRIVPINSAYIGALSSVIIFSGFTKPIASGFDDVVFLDEGTVATIVSTAPFCDSYPGFSCNVLLPPNCYAKLNQDSTLLISGVVTDYGLDLRSLRCYSTEEEIKDWKRPIVVKKAHCL